MRDVPFETAILIVLGADLLLAILYLIAANIGRRGRKG